MNESENINLEEFQPPIDEQEPSNSENENPNLEMEESDNRASDKEEQTEKEQREDYKNQLEGFLKDFEAQTDIENKLQLALDFMEASLGFGGTPHFRNFWEARRLALPLFKDNISSAQRNALWSKFSELSKEARRLKEILDEQSAFAVEQIDIAVKALEQDISDFDKQVEKAGLPENFAFPQFLENKKSFYFQLQQQLNILNTQASRINALRKELLKTEMRIRQKNKFFQRLSIAGDLVFPKRKELIKQISQQFLDDVEEFIRTYFTEQGFKDSLYVLREEIKSMQGLAKILTLNTHSFTQTRMRLSACWDKIKVEEKERKKERAHQKGLYRQNALEIKALIQALNEQIEATPEASSVSWQNALNEISTKMRNVELGRDELKELRDELHEIRKKIQEKAKSEETARFELEEAQKMQKRAKYQAFKDQIEQLIAQEEQYEADDLIQKRDELIAEISSSTLTKNEKLELERLLKPLKDLITDKKEKALLNLSEDDRQALNQLQEILKQRKERKQEIKNQLESLRKAAGSSSLDFEKAMQHTTQINEEKERLEKINQGIEELEQKMAQLKSKIKGK